MASDDALIRVESGQVEDPPSPRDPQWECKICGNRNHTPPLTFLGASARKSLSGVPLWWGRGKRTLDLRKYAAELLESRETHIIVISLTLLDLCIVLTELVLAGFYPEHEHRPPAVERAEEALSWTSIAILSLFTIEQLLKLAVFGIQYFFHIWHALDAVIIVASLVLESVLRGTTQEAVSLLVVFRLWRLVRVLHSTAETMVLRQEDMLEEHHRLVKDLEQELAVEKHEVEVLRGRLLAHGLDDELNLPP